jgi:hypothetical protein
MHRLYTLGLLLSLAYLSFVSAWLPPNRLRSQILSPPLDAESTPVTSRNGTRLPPFNTTYYFDQLKDHNNPSLGTFRQRYWHTYQFYESGKYSTSHSSVPFSHSSLTGGPIILLTPGEINAEGMGIYIFLCGFMFKFQIAGYYVELGNKSILGLIGLLSAHLLHITN